MGPYIVMGTAALGIVAMGWFALHLERRHDDDRKK